MTDVPVPPSEEEEDPPGPNCFAISASSSLAFADALSGVIVCISLLVCKPCPPICPVCFSGGSVYILMDSYWVLSPPGSMSISRVSDILSESMKLVWENMVIVLKLICQVIGAGQVQEEGSQRTCSYEEARLFDDVVHSILKAEYIFLSR